MLALILETLRKDAYKTGARIVLFIKKKKYILQSPTEAAPAA